MEQLKALSLVETMELPGFRSRADNGSQQFSFCGLKRTKIMTQGLEPRSWLEARNLEWGFIGMKRD